MGLVAPRHVGSSQTRAQTRVPCIGRWILNHCATREVLWHPFGRGSCCCFKVAFSTALIHARQSFQKQVPRESFSYWVDVWDGLGINILALCHGHCFCLLLIRRHSLKAEITGTFAGKQYSLAGDRHQNNL